MAAPTTIMLLSLAVLAATGRAQHVCASGNQATPTLASIMNIAPAWILARYTAPQALNNVSGLDLAMFSNSVDLAVQVGIFDADPATGAPRTQVAGGTAIVNPERRQYSATLAPATTIAANATVYFGARTGLAGGRFTEVLIVPPRPGSELWFSTHGGGWIPVPPGSQGDLTFRIYCGSHTGSHGNFGVGKPGTGGATPRLFGLGFANLGNPFAIQIVDSAPRLPAAWLFGAPTQFQFPPFGTIYVTPVWFVVPGTIGGGGTSGGYASLEFVIGNDPVLTGSTYAVQSWILDPAAAGGFAHTDRLTFTVGN